jgi:hypothetical protein
MPRQLRIEYPGAIHHVMNRGDRREDLLNLGTSKSANVRLHSWMRSPPSPSSTSQPQLSYFNDNDAM